MIRRYACLLLLAMISVVLAGEGTLAADKKQAGMKGTNGILLGQFMVNDKTPLSHGRLYLYINAVGPSAANAIMRVPDNIVTLDKNGKFNLELPPGTYRISASRLPETGPIGPPLEGDPIYFKMDSTGEEVIFQVKARAKTDTGVISTSRPMIRNYKGETVIEGMVKDTDGLPVEGAVIYAYLEQGITNKAFQVSEKTSADGKFTLAVNNGATYYLRVRGAYGGGVPKEGEIVDSSDPKTLTPITVKIGEKLSGIELKVKRQQQRGPRYQENSGQPL